MTEAAARAELRAVIETAFARTPYPGDDAIVAHRCWECDEVAKAFRGKRWLDFRARPLDLIGPPNRDAFASFTPEAFRHYLPLALLAAVDFYEESDVLADAAVFYLDPSQAKQSERYDERLARFSGPERQALLSFLLFMKKWHARDFGEGPRKASLASAIRAIRERLRGSTS